MVKRWHPLPIILATVGGITVLLAGTGKIPGLLWLVGVAFIVLSVWARARYQNRAGHMTEPRT